MIKKKNKSSAMSCSLVAGMQCDAMLLIDLGRARIGHFVFLKWHISMFISRGTRCKGKVEKETEADFWGSIWFDSHWFVFALCQIEQKSIELIEQWIEIMSCVLVFCYCYCYCWSHRWLLRTSPRFINLICCCCCCCFSRRNPSCK